MSLATILILIGLSLGVYLSGFFPLTRSWRTPLLLVISIVVIYWLQPGLPIRGLDFWLPTATVLIALLGWVLTAQPEERLTRANLKTTFLLAGTILAIALTRYLGATGLITPSRPPQIYLVTLVLIVSGGIFYLFARFVKTRKALLTAAIFSLVMFFVLLKLPPLTLALSSILRGISGQSRELASALDIRWLGFSYIAFRLIHTLRDRQTGHLPSLSLDEYLVYLLFFPAFSAGPIDRSERFINQLHQPFLPATDHLAVGGSRLLLGLFKKFVLADTLAMIALNGQNAGQVISRGWLWLTLLAYSLQIVFDFSGYTDIAIGLGQLVGIRLPENFNTPYLKPSLTRFWDNWHMTLTQWFRAYVFNPLTRSLRTNARSLPAWLVILVTQVLTMAVIGLWHGITLNFLFWGLWHGVGLFINNRWTNVMRPLTARVQVKPAINHLLTVFSTLLTFTYVSLGWVWFALPDLASSLRVFAGLFGIGGAA